MMLLIARIAVGIGEASLSPAANSLLASRFPRHMLTTVLPIYTMGVKVGSAGAFILGGLLIAAAGVWVVTYDALADFEPWQIVFMATGLPAVLLALLVFTFKEPPRPAKKKAGVKPAAIIPFMRERKRLFIPMLIGFSLIALCTYSLTGWVPTYLHRHFGMEPVVYGPILGLISTIAAFTLAFKGMFVDWLYRRGMKDAHIRFYTWLLIGSLPVVFALFWVQQPVIFMIMYGALQVVSIPIMAYVSAAMQLIAPTELRGRITGVFLFCLNGVGGGLGPVIVGSLTEYVFRDEMKVGWSLAVLICTAIPLALVLLRLALKPLRAAIVEAEEREMIDSIFRFSETTVGEVMIPRVDVIALDRHASLQAALDTIVEGGHSRIPIYEDTIDHVIGVLYAKDLLGCYREGMQNVKITDLMRTPYFVPESAMVDDLLGDLQHKKVHLAIVVDEYGGTAGVVTIEDLLEEIVGEIQDEYDSEAPLIQRQAPGVYLVRGRVDIDDLNRELGLHLTDADESYTLAGVIFSHLQRVPDVGDTLDLDGARIEILAVNDNRIEQVRLSVVAAQEGPTGEGASGEGAL
ncbi:MAG: MFS transporter [Caldilineales bacterium]|nr:MFS transporter [Caldilineales bacterium]